MIVVELKEDQPTLACYVDIIGRRSYLRTSNIQTSFYVGQTQQLPQHGKEERHTLRERERECVCVCVCALAFVFLFLCYELFSFVTPVCRSESVPLVFAPHPLVVLSFCNVGVHSVGSLVFPFLNWRVAVDGIVDPYHVLEVYAASFFSLCLPAFN